MLHYTSSGGRMLRNDTFLEKCFLAFFSCWFCLLYKYTLIVYIYT